MVSNKDKDGPGPHPLKRDDSAPAVSPTGRPRRRARHGSPSSVSSSRSYDSYDSLSSSSRSPSPRTRRHRRHRRHRRERSPSPPHRRHTRRHTRQPSRSRSRSDSRSDSRSRSPSRSRSYSHSRSRSRSRSHSRSQSSSRSRSRSRSPSSLSSSRSYSPRDSRAARSPSWRSSHRRAPYRPRAWTPSRSRSPRGHRARATRYPESGNGRAYAPSSRRGGGDRDGDDGRRRGRPWRGSGGNTTPTTAMMMTPQQPPSWRRERGLKRKHSPPRLMPTVFVTKLAQKVRRDDVADLFARAGRVRDVRMVTDRVTSRHKGAAYVEFDDRDAVSAAVGLSGSLLCGVAVEIRAWVDGSRDDWRGVRRGPPPQEAEAEVDEDGAPVTVGWSSRPPMHRGSRPQGGADTGVVGVGGPLDGAKGIGLPTELVPNEELKLLLNPKGLPVTPYATGMAQVLARSGDAGLANGKDAGMSGRALDRVALPLVKAEGATRVFVDGFASGMRAEQLREVFMEFGDVVWCEIVASVKGRGNRICIVEFSNAASARKACEADGVMLEGRALRVFDKRSDAGLEVCGEIDAGGEGGVNLNSTRRAMLMQQLSRGESVGGRKLQGDLDKLKTQSEASVALMLSNMFDPDSEYEGFENDVKEDVRDECADKYGKVVHVSVEKESHGVVYVRFENVADAVKARTALDGRWFGGKKISAGFVLDEDYVKRFPSCVEATDM